MRDLDEPGAFWDFVSSGRIDGRIDSGVSGATYTYQRTGTNAGGLELLFGVDERCLIQVTFDSTTIGTMTFACKADDYELETPGVWELAEVPAAGFAPEDQAAFDARFIGERWILTSDPNLEEPFEIVWYFISSGVYEDYEDGERTESGTYAYQNTGLNTGIIRVVLSKVKDSALSKLLTSHSILRLGAHSASCSTVRCKREAGELQALRVHER